MSEAKEEISREITRRRPRFDDTELVMLNKLRFLIDELPPDAQIRAVRYLAARYDPAGLKGAAAGRGVAALIPGDLTFE